MIPGVLGPRGSRVLTFLFRPACQPTCRGLADATGGCSDPCSMNGCAHHAGAAQAINSNLDPRWHHHPPCARDAPLAVTTGWLPGSSSAAGAYCLLSTQICVPHRLLNSTFQPRPVPRLAPCPSPRLCRLFVPRRLIHAAAVSSHSSRALLLCMWCSGGIFS